MNAHSRNVQGARLDLGLGPLELRVMDVLWVRGGWLTVQDVCDEVNRKSPRQLAYSTIKTVLCHLTEKHYAKKRALGRAHEYMARATRTQAERAAVSDFVAPLVTDGRGLIAHLVDEIAVSESALEELERLIEEKRRTR